MKRGLLGLLVVAGLGAALFACQPHGPGFRNLPASRTGRVPADTVLRGEARIVDGDTLDVAGRRIRLFGVDAPEHAQTCTRARASYPCGEEARAALRRMVAGEEISCRVRDNDRYGRLVAVCFAGGRDVNEALVEQGWAVAYRTYSTAYVAAEDRAREGRKGIWAGNFERPQDWRRRHNPR
ncbi:MAG TPA: thermonuclease family protein [Acetobacteraceae bacterium]|jgi:endonuclease YncB( thermonuclease family)